MPTIPQEQNIKRGPRLIGALVVIAFAGMMIPALAASIQLPAITEPATAERHPGKLVFVELVTPDINTAKKFYGGLFGWTFRDIHADGLEYAEAFHHGRQVAGLVHKDVPAGQHRQPAWLSFFSATDVDSVEKTAVENGAKVLFPPHDVPGRGREAVLADPQGAVFAVISSSSGDPSDYLADPGEWIWSSLITRDPDNGAAFYQKLFDYEVFELPPSKNASHLLLATDNYARASANGLPSSKPGMHPHWLNFVRVRDAAKMAKKVTQLGGRVLVEPRTDRHGGKIAVVADPTGAPFGLLEWPATESKKVSP